MVEKKTPRTEIIRAYFKNNPTHKAMQAAANLGIPVKYVHQTRYIDNRKAKEAKKAAKAAAAKKLQHMRTSRLRLFTATSDQPLPEVDMVNSPPHYKRGGIETIDFIEAKQLPYNLGNVVKYITRAEHKGSEVEDLRKAQWYLSREIRRVTNARA